MFTCDTPGATFIIRTTGGGNMGDVAETTIVMDGNYFSFPLTGTNFTDIGVDILNVAWNWQYKTEQANWTAIGTTNFTIYTVISQPTAPWSNSNNSTDTQLPWTDVLDVACVWAKGATTTDSVNELITKAVFNLGATTPPLIKYNTSTGTSAFCVRNFNCTAFLERLDGQGNRGAGVNGSDCATIVSSFSNILGSDLWQSRMAHNFALRRVRVIGTPNFAVPFNGSFSYHEVAWKGECTTDCNVYDACLELNSNRVAGAPVPLLAVNIPFGSCTDLSAYRAYLTTNEPNGCAACLPQPTTRQRRSVS